jgi:hypothetical protein
MQSVSTPAKERLRTALPEESGLFIRTALTPRVAQRLIQWPRSPCLTMYHTEKTVMQTCTGDGWSAL